MMDKSHLLYFHHCAILANECLEMIFLRSSPVPVRRWEELGGARQPIQDSLSDGTGSLF